MPHTWSDPVAYRYGRHKNPSILSLTALQYIHHLLRVLGLTDLPLMIQEICGSEKGTQVSRVCMQIPEPSLPYRIPGYKDHKSIEKAGGKGARGNKPKEYMASASEYRKAGIRFYQARISKTNSWSWKTSFVVNKKEWQEKLERGELGWAKEWSSNHGILPLLDTNGNTRDLFLLTIF